MLTSSLPYIITRSFPECILLMLASYILLNIKFNLVEIIRESIFFVAIVLVIRKLPISFGIHTILIMFTLGIILYKLKGQNIIDTILSIAKIFICLAISEGIYMIIATGILNIPVDILTDNTEVLAALLSLPSLVIFILLVLILKSVQDKLLKKNK